ncbi:sulfotransferase family protein [Nitzschia inconspicua]|uniref:Sulfotransferase family protein n=1 Tax=Nitzschia inconspicua TaxID=303405 RepID=A0A9K3LPL4_9STRA|nr:sulfotransferase family protein [Nitzschia inconspicua]
MKAWNTTHLALCLALLYFSLQIYVICHFDVSVPDGEGQSQPSVSLLTSSAAQEEPNIDLEVEIQKGYAYAHSIQNFERHLKFVHIPKAAGSALEEVAGRQAKIDWGSCLFNHRPKRRGNVCRYPPGQFEWPRSIGWWHIPPSLFPVLGVNPYDDADLFVVVRNVSERLLSEYYYQCWKDKKNSDCDSSRMDQAAYLNEWLTDKLTRVSTMNRPNRTAPDDYLHHNGHFTPQYDFVVSPLGVRMVDYVLHMDRLPEEFPALMQAYGLNISLPAQKTNTVRNHTTDLHVDSIDSKVQELIRKVYRDDLELTR